MIGVFLSAPADLVLTSAHRRFRRKDRHARLPLLFPERAGPDRGLREHRGGRTSGGSRPGTRTATPAAQAQGYRDLGRTEPALSRPEKTNWAVQDFYCRLKTRTHKEQPFQANLGIRVRVG